MVIYTMLRFVNLMNVARLNFGRNKCDMKSSKYSLDNKTPDWILYIGVT